MMKSIFYLFASLAFILTSRLSHSADYPVYGAVEGQNHSSFFGYREFRSESDIWYLTYQGSYAGMPVAQGREWVNAAWNHRAAELCKSMGAQYYIPLRYIFEDVMKAGKQKTYSSEESQSYFSVYPVRSSTIFIPIYVPAVPVGPFHADGPSKSGAVKCIFDPDGVKDKFRILKFDDAAALARSNKVIEK